MQAAEEDPPMVGRQLALEVEPAAPHQRQHVAADRGRIVEIDDDQRRRAGQQRQIRPDAAQQRIGKADDLRFGELAEQPGGRPGGIARRMADDDAERAGAQVLDEGRQAAGAQVPPSGLVGQRIAPRPQQQGGVGEDRLEQVAIADLEDATRHGRPLPVGRQRLRQAPWRTRRWWRKCMKR